MKQALERFSYDGIGYAPLLITDQWMAAILNWEPTAERENLREIERHNQTDEVFVLLKGQAVLFVYLDGQPLIACKLEPAVIYNVPAGVWHNVLSSRDAKYLIVENRDTHIHDTEIRPITPEELLSLDDNWLIGKMIKEGQPGLQNDSSFGIPVYGGYR